MQIFSEQLLRAFESRAVDHLRTCIPEDCERLGNAALIGSVQRAIRESKTYGLETEYQILTYLNLMYVLGFDFATDARYPWAPLLLTDKRLRGEVKTTLLLAAARKALSVTVA